MLDAQGLVSEVHVRYDPKTRSGRDQSGRKVKGTIHWVHAASARKVDVRLYDRLFTVPDPGNYEDLASVMNSESLINGQALAEPALGTLMPDAYFQFERVGFLNKILRVLTTGSFITVL